MAFADVAPTIAAAGVTEAEVLAEVVEDPPPKAATEPLLRDVEIRLICKYASVYGKDLNTITDPVKRALADQSIEQFALKNSLWPEQVKRVMQEFKAAVSPKAPKSVAVPKVGV